MKKKLSKQDEIVKRLVDSAHEATQTARLVSMEWQWSIMAAAEALGVNSTTARMWKADEIVDALSRAIDTADEWQRLSLCHIRDYFVLAGRAVWSHCDLLVAFTRLRESANADPLEWAPVMSQREEAR